MFIGVYTCIYFVLIDRVGEGIAPLAIVVYIDGSFVKHKIPVKPIYITVRNLSSVVSGKALCMEGSWHDAQPAQRVQPLRRVIHGGRIASSSCTMLASLMLSR